MVPWCWCATITPEVSAIIRGELGEDDLQPENKLVGIHGGKPLVLGLEAPLGDTVHVVNQGVRGHVVND